MTHTQTIIALTLAATLSGCAFLEKGVREDIGNRLSEPYQAPQIVVDIQEQTTTLDAKAPVSSFVETMRQWHGPSLVAVEIMLPKNTSKRTRSQLESAFLQGHFNAQLRMTNHTMPDFTVTAYSSIANVIGCDNPVAKPESRDGKTGYTPSFECSSLMNLAASTANPRDLLNGRDLIQPTSINATSALQNYHTGSVIQPSLQDVSVGGAQ